MIFSTRFRCALLLGVLLSWTLPTWAQDFRILSKVFVLSPQGPVQITENLTLFHQETVYDFLIRPGGQPDQETGEITVARTQATACFPADFMLVGAMNP